MTETVQKSLDVRSVVNELAVQPTISWTQRISDSKLATTVRSRMVMEDNVYLSQMKVVVERGIVYIMGIVTPQENTTYCMHTCGFPPRNRRGREQARRCAIPPEKAFYCGETAARCFRRRKNCLHLRSVSGCTLPPRKPAGKFFPGVLPSFRKRGKDFPFTKVSAPGLNGTAWSGNFPICGLRRTEGRWARGSNRFR